MKKIFLKLFVLTSVFLYLPCVTGKCIASDEFLDIVIVDDESASMDTNDPYNVRWPSIKRIIDRQKILNQANNLAVIKFGTTVDETYAKLTQNYAWLYSAFDSGMNVKNNKKTYTSLEESPPRGFTDTLAALEKAFVILNSSPDKRDGKPVKKIIFLLTDGIVEPWPGVVASVRDKYLESIISKNKYGFCSKGNTNENPFCEEARTLSRQLILDDFVSRAKQRGIRIYAVGFGNADEDFLRRLSRQTLADYKKLNHYSQIDDLIDGYMPPVSNELDLFSKELCEQGNIDFEVASNLDVLALTVNFTKQIARLPVDPDKEIGLVITGPDGTIYNSGSGISYRTPLDKHNTKRYSHAYFHHENPVPGTWNVSMHPEGYENICGQVKAQARLNEPPQLEISPQPCEVGSSLEISAWMKSVDGTIRPEIHVEGRIESELTISELNFKTTGGKHIASFRPSVKGEYRIVVRYFLGHGTARREKIITVLPKQPCVLDMYQADDNQAVDTAAVSDLIKDGIYLGMLGYPRTSVQKTIKFKISRCNVSSLLNISLSPFRHEQLTSSIIPSGWVEIVPSGSLPVDITKETELTVIVTMPKSIPSSLKDGKYIGKLKIMSADLDQDYQIPLSLNLEPPKIILNGIFVEGNVDFDDLPDNLRNFLKFDFSSTLTKRHRRSLRMKVAAGTKAEGVYYNVMGDPDKVAVKALSPYFKYLTDTNDGYVVEMIRSDLAADACFKRIKEKMELPAISFAPLELELVVNELEYLASASTGHMVSGINIFTDIDQHFRINTPMPINIEVSLANQNVDEARIPGGLYIGKLIVSGDYLKPGYLPVHITIPERTGRETWYRWLFGPKR